MELKGWTYLSTILGLLIIYGPISKKYYPNYRFCCSWVDIARLMSELADAKAKDESHVAYHAVSVYKAGSYLRE